MAKETNKGDVESICIRVTKPASKRWRTLKFIWIDYEQLIRPIDCFDCILMSTNNFAYLIPIPMFSLVSWYLHWAPAPRVRRAWKLMGNISMEWAKVPSFVWEKVLFYREVKLLITFSGTFSSFKSYMLNNAAARENLILKIFKLMEKVFYSLTIHRKLA